MSRIAPSVILCLLLLPQVAFGDIFRWEDEGGTVHFTDDPTNIPPGRRGKAKIVIREVPREPVPSGSPPANAVTSPAAPHPSSPAISKEEAAAANARERNSISSRLNQLKAKISAKENLIKSVEKRGTPANQASGNRAIDPGDMELYRKYKKELPEDMERLQELETLIQLFN